MKLVWTPRAADDLEALVEYIRPENESAALRVANRIVDRLTALAHLPLTGRTGIRTGTREVLLTPYPFIAIYKVSANEMRVLEIRHGARNRPAR